MGVTSDVRKIAVGSVWWRGVGGGWDEMVGGAGVLKFNEGIRWTIVGRGVVAEADGEARRGGR